MTIDPYDNTTWPPFSDERGDGRDPYGVHKKYCAAAPSVGSFCCGTLLSPRFMLLYERVGVLLLAPSLYLVQLRTEIYSARKGRFR
jgi:hypothetical protein